MIITKKESKQLRYLARANYKADVKGAVAEDGGKVKHRDFPVFGLSYDEKKADKDKVELTNVTIGGKPFDGEYTALMARLRVLLDSPDDICAEELEQDKTLTEQAVGAVKAKSDTIVIAEKPGDILKETLKDCFPGGSGISVDVKPEENKIDANVFIPNSVDHIDAKIEVKPMEGHEKKTIIVTGPVCPERHDSRRDYSGLSEEAIAEAYKSVVGEDIGTMKPSVEPPTHEEASVAESLEYIATHEPPPLVVAPLAEPQELPVIEDVVEAKKVAKETGTPVITAEQRKDTIHLDSVAEGTNDVTTVVGDPQPKKLTRGELNDLRIKCAVMKLAKSYGEPADMSIGEILLRYPNASMKLNDLYVADRIKPYTISEDAIKNAYPDEYAALCS